MRLTCKGTNLLLVNKEFGNEMYLKLMQLENIEEKLGIDLITLSDILLNKKTIWVKLIGDKDTYITQSNIMAFFQKESYGLGLILTVS